MVTYNTKQKQLVLRLIEEYRHKQLTCDEITQFLSDEGTPVGRTTVYRQLEKLASDGKIKKHFSRTLKSYTYQFIDVGLNCDEHMHLRCVYCGKYEHLGCEFMSKVSEHISKHHNFTVDNSHTEIVGVCGKCSEERAKVN